MPIGLRPLRIGAERLKERLPALNLRIENDDLVFLSFKVHRDDLQEPGRARSSGSPKVKRSLI